MSDEKISERDERLRKLDEITKAGIDPYPAHSGKTHLVSQILENFTDLEKSKTKVILGGRLRTNRTHGNLTFCNLQDGSGIIQIALSKKEIGDEKYKQFVKLIDMGDFVEITGTCFVTHKGEESVMASDWKILSKAILPLPEKWHGLKDEEERYRKRYLDILTNDDLRDMFIKRAKFWQVTRQFLVEHGFLEVETPTLETTTGGAEANPFRTHHDDFDIDVFLRISVGELWQKRLMGAGFDKTFEIGRVFRNEGSSPNHLQEFTNMEFYWAYADYKDGMKLVRELYLTIAKEVFGTTKFTTREHTYDLADEWVEIDYQTEIKKQTGIDVITSTELEIKNKLEELKVKYEGANRERLTDTLWKYCRKNISGPAFLVGHPKLISPLAKEVETNPNITQRFQPIIAGAEVGNGYSELNNPLDQRKRFEEQQELLKAGDTEAMMPDWEFVEMLEHGMPPTCGFGFGERLFAFLCDKTLREATLFPLLRPKISSENILPKTKVEKSNSENIDLGIDYAGAVKLLNENVQDKIIKMHMLESEAIMRALAAHFGEDEEKWGIIGLLHDIDWDKTKDDKKNHTILAVDILKNAGASDFLIETIVSHTYGSKDCGAYPDKARTTKLQHSLTASETATGLIIATALMQPDKKLASVKLSSLKKKFKTKAFAANCNRDLISEIEKTGITVDDFLEIALGALVGIGDKLGM